MNENENKQPMEPIADKRDEALQPVDQIEAAAAEETRIHATSAAQPVRKTAAPWPWIAIAALAVAALIFFLIRDNHQAAGGAKNEVLGQMDGAAFTKADVYDEIAKQLQEGQAASALDNLMLVKVVELEAKKSNITATNEEIDAEIASTYRKNFASDEEFNAALQQNHMTLDELKERTAVSVKLRNMMALQIKPTDDQLKKYYDDHKDTFSTTPEQVRASHILLTTKAEAEAVLAELKKGADFAQLAKEKSQDPGSKDKGGDLDFFARGTMNAEFEGAAFALKKGEMSGVVQSSSGFHIIKVTDKKAAVTPAYDKVKQQVKNAYLDQQMQTLMPDWFEKKKKEYHYKNLLSTPANAATPAPTASAPATVKP